MDLIFALSCEGKKGYTLPALDVEPSYPLDEKYLRKTKNKLPEVNEVEVVRHFLNLSVKNFHIDRNFYPLGSCTMKYNPKINERIASNYKFREIHPLQPEDTVQGALQIIYELQKFLCEISGMDEVSLIPSAGAHSEIVSLLMIKKYFEKIGEKRNKIILPDSSHGTNPASSSLAEFTPIEIKSNEKGRVNISVLKEVMDEKVACIMLTIPNTLGLFEDEIEEICSIVHNYGGIVYLDGANLNAFLGILKVRDLGIDFVHFNLHKTFSTPHGTGGPGGGGIGVVSKFAKFLPIPRVVKLGEKFSFDYNYPDSIGIVHSFYGNFNVLLKAYTYIRMLGKENIRKVAENAIINANYVMNELKDIYYSPYQGPCMHEFVLSGNKQKEYGVKTLDIAKRLLDYGFHPPTIYFPLIVPEALMIEPTETESKYTLDEFISAMKKIDEEAKNKSELVKNAPHNTPIKRLDEVKASKELSVNYYEQI